MKSLSHYAGAELQCVQPSLWKREFEISANDETIFSLRFPYFFKIEAVAEGFGKIWKFRNAKFFSTEIEVREEGYELPFAKYTAKAFKFGGMYELPRGERCKCEYNLWKGIYTVTTQSGLVLFRYERKISLKHKADISIPKRNETLDANPWMPMMIVFIDIMKRGNSGG